MPITIFCDSEKALTTIRQPTLHKEIRFLREQIYYKAKGLQSHGHIIVFRWTPSDTGLIRNKKAELAARNRAENGAKKAARWSLLINIKKNLTQVRSTELIKWQETKI